MGMKALKRQRRSWEAHDEDPGYGTYFVLEPLPAGPHAPAKPEAKLLRRICAQTGLTEEQVRARRAYRQRLAAASKPRPGRHPAYSVAVRIRKGVTAATGLAPHHPDFLAAFAPSWVAYAARVSTSRRLRALGEVSASAALEISLTKPRAE